MPNRLLPHQHENAWLLQGGRWRKIRNPIYRDDTARTFEATPQGTFRQTLQPYTRYWWTLGPIFPLHDYSGILVSSYIYLKPEARKPRYLLYISSLHKGNIVFAQDFPDFLTLLKDLAPIVLTGVVVDMYMRAWRMVRRTKKRS